MRGPVVLDDLLHGLGLFVHSGVGIGWCRRSIGGCVNTFVGVDHHLAHLAGADFVEVFGVGDDELAAPEGMVHPGAAELLDVHAQLHLVDPDFFQHGGLANVTKGELRVS
jgi:hypothetical protein